MIVNRYPTHISSRHYNTCPLFYSAGYANIKHFLVFNFTFLAAYGFTVQPADVEITSTAADAVFSCSLAEGADIESVTWVITKVWRWKLLFS